MGSDPNHLMLYATFVKQGGDHYYALSDNELSQLTASVQWRFPDHLVEPADPAWLRRAVNGTLPIPAADLEPAPPWEGSSGGGIAPSSSTEPWKVEYLYLVLGWLGGTVSKEVAERAIQAATEVVVQWMKGRRRRATEHVAYLLGPKGEVLKTVTVSPRSSRSHPRLWRRLDRWRQVWKALTGHSRT